MAESLEERLRDHSRAFEGLLSIIPAEHYYGKDTSDQWRRKKQTPEERRAAKRAKLDPDNSKTAKDVMDENARKRKREEEGHLSEMQGITTEAPKEGLKRVDKKQKKAKQAKKEGGDELEQMQSPDDAVIASKKAEQRREKRKEKQEKDKQTKAKKKEKQKRRAKKGKTSGSTEEKGEENEDASESEGDDDEVDDIDFDGLDETKELEPATEASSAPPSKAPSPIFDQTQHPSGTSSISSVTTHNAGSTEQPAKRPKLEVKIDQEELRERLQKRIAELRAARKADNADGTPARTRSELIDMRRKKEEEKKKNRKALRQQAKEEERRQKEEALARGSPLLSPSGMSPRSGNGQSPLSDPANNFSFGRVAFNNGQFMNASLDSVIDSHKSKGPSDPYSALQAAKNKAARFNALDSEKKADIEEKDMWLNAKKRAQGERVRDDTSLLKKTLKRKEKQKKKSEKEWNERLNGVAKAQAERQKKREENLANRKEAKGAKGKGGKKSGPKKGKRKARPGFEGSFKAGR